MLRLCDLRDCEHVRFTGALAHFQIIPSFTKCKFHALHKELISQPLIQEDFDHFSVYEVMPDFLQAIATIVLQDFLQAHCFRELNQPLKHELMYLPLYGASLKTYLCEQLQLAVA